MKLATTLSALFGATTLLAAGPALAAADLSVSIPAPAAQNVYDELDYEVVVANVGNRSAQSVSLTITLPETHTSPVVHVMGVLGAIDSRCTLSGTQLTCSLGKIRRNKSTTVSFAIALPEAAETLPITAVAATSSNENNLTNNEATDIASLLNYTVAVADGDLATNHHCTGQGLTSFYECALYPSSISSHDILFNGDGTLDLVGAGPGYSGTWAQDTAESLEFTYFFNGDVVAEFSGYGASPGCFEGLTSFPGSAYVAPYEVCI